MTMSERIPVVIPTMPQRRDVLAKLVDELKAHAWAEVRISQHVDSRQDVSRAVNLANASAPDWWVYLEDDVELSPRFDEIPRLISEATALSHRGKRVGAVCFFWTTKLPDGLTIMPASRMSMSQCTAVRGCDPFEFAEFARDWYADHPQHHHASDLLLGAWTRSRGEMIAVQSPSLVQHLPLPSTLGPRSRNRQSVSYARAFG
jgi:hypothetical protein